jgi:hypothetical protein
MRIGGLSNWYSTVFMPSVELIDHFVNQVEPQITDATQKYEAGKRTYFAIDDAEREGRQYAQQVERYQSLDSMAWDMKALFEEHFPNLQRRSALITVYSSFEHEFIQLCALFQREKHLRVGVYDLSGHGIWQAANYLEKVAQLDTQRGSHQWQAINHIRVIRNMIVHRDGKLLDAQGERPKKETNAIDALKYVHASELEVLLEPEFVAEVVRTFTSYFTLINDSIQRSAVVRGV